MELGHFAVGRIVLGPVALGLCGVLASGCIAEHTYPGYGDVYDSTVGEVFGSVGSLDGIENRFVRPGAELFATEGNPTMNVSLLDNELYAGAVVQHPRGQVYLDISVFNLDAMEPGRPYTVALDGAGYTQEGDFVYGEETASDEPSISVYACPESPWGSVGQSGNAEEVTVVLEQPSPDVTPTLTFSATADNPEQALFLDGWFKGETTGSSW